MKHIQKINEYFDLNTYYDTELINLTKNHKDRFLRTFPEYDTNIKTYTYSFLGEYEIDINYNEINKYISVSFNEKKHEYTNTNKFDQIKVLNTVFNTILDFIDEYNIETILLRIYKIVASKKLSTWIITETDIVDDRRFLIIKKQKN